MSQTRGQRPGALVGGKYRLVRRLAIGGMGEVWVARNRTTGAEVAVKLGRSDAGHDEAVARFRQEARLGASLSHRGIVRIFDFVEEPDGTPVLVMELLFGETLERSLQERGALASDEAIAITLCVLSALAHVHDAGLVHRDVTPANIFLAVDPDGQVTPKLVDFGIAKWNASDVRTADGCVLGTPRYMAPERIRGECEIDARSDLFSIAVVLYEMLTGVSPFAAASASASLAAVLEDVVDPAPELDPRLWVELRRALSKRAYQRHASAREMAEALRLAVGETDANLAQRLWRTPPAREKASRQGGLVGPAPSVDGHSIATEAPGAARRRAIAGWLAGALLTACLAAAGTVAIRHKRADRVLRPAPAAAPIDPPATTPSVEVPVRTGADPALGVPAASPVGSAMTPWPTPSPTQRARGQHRSKPVATTPGF
jgi:eukaryotic-like serine/threonine-protein kinase